MNVYVREVYDDECKSLYTADILKKLPEWFGNQIALKEYVKTVKEHPYFAAFDDENICIGFFSLRLHYQHTGEIYVCGVSPEVHHKGIGKAIFIECEKYFINAGCKYLIVKTLSDLITYKPYENTRKFYESIGFSSLITLTEMWDEDNPCLLMIKQLY